MSEVQSTKALLDALCALHASARAAWPQVSIESLDFAHYAAERIDRELAVEDALSVLRASDLYLACACARGDRAGLRAFEDRFLSQVPTMLARLDPGRSLCDEVAQELRAELLVSANGPPGIAEYSARGDLIGWLRVVALRTALRLRAEQKKATSTDPGAREAALLGQADPELDYLKLRYRADFEGAFQSAMSQLSSRERLYLRLHYVDGLSIDKMGSLYRVHRSTIARRIAASRSMHAPTCSASVSRSTSPSTESCPSRDERWRSSSTPPPRARASLPAPPGHPRACAASSLEV